MMRLYPRVQVEAQSFEGTKKFVVPSQSMTLSEIIRRFVRKEPLPVGNGAELYEERMGDLEKLAKEDITIQMEKAESIKKSLARIEAKQKKEDLEKAKVESPSLDVPPKGGVTGNGKDGQAPPSPTDA